jgi:drug/metabolite transporter (DMT)-like permease
VSRSRIALLTLLAMLAFAGNSLLCRLALKHTAIDAASFTAVRLISASVVLCVLAGGWGSNWLNGWRSAWQGGGNWSSALALFAYAAGFSFAYISLPAATGALLLFGAVQATMIGYGVWAGERLLPLQIVGLVFALCGLVALVLPGLAAPPPGSALLMVGAGVAWGVYSLRGRSSAAEKVGPGSPITVTAGNFMRTVPLTLGLSLLMASSASLDGPGVWYGVMSGALTSGIGYAIWYRVLPALKASSAATVQLSVPVIAAAGGVVLIGEPLSLRLVLASIAILAGIALVIFNKKPTPLQMSRSSPAAPADNAKP